MTGNERYPGISRATLLIATDNGGINRDRSVKQQRKDLCRWLAGQPTEMIEPIEAWLSKLSDDEMAIVCCDPDEGGDLMKLAPPFTDDFLDRYFHEVC